MLGSSLPATEWRNPSFVFETEHTQHELVSARRADQPLHSYHTPLFYGPFSGYCPTELPRFSEELMAYTMLGYVNHGPNSHNDLWDRFEHLTAAQQHQLLEMHQYYRMSNFIACISRLPEYAPYITKLYGLQHESTKLGQWWNTLTGKVPRNIEQLYRHLHPSTPFSRNNNLPLPASANTMRYDAEEVRLTIESSDTHYDETIAQRRLHAFHQAHASNYAHVERFVGLSTMSHDFLQNAGLDASFFSHCTGDAYQQQLHQEFVNTIDQAALLRSANPRHQLINDITQSVGECALLGCSYSSAGKVVEATHAADLCHTLVEFAHAIIEGIYDGFCAAGHGSIATVQEWGVIGRDAALHPSQALRNLATYARTKAHIAAHGIDRGLEIITRLTDHMVDFLCDAGDLVISCFADPPLGEEVMYGAVKKIGEDWETATARICQCCVAFADAVPHHCTPENARIRAALITEYGLHGAAAIISNKLYARIAHCALSYAAGSATKAGKALFDVASHTTQRMAQFAADAGTTIGKSKYISVTSRFFTAQKNDFTGLITWSRGLMVPCKQLTGLLKNKTITVTEEFLQHLFTAELKTYTKRSGHIIKKLSGFHHFKKEKLEELGLQLLNSKVCKKTGVILADVLCDGHIERDKTFFPSAWSNKTVLKKIAQALGAPVEPAIVDRGGIVVFGKTAEGIILKIVLNVEGSVVTAFPDAARMGLLN